MDAANKTSNIRENCTCQTIAKSSSAKKRWKILSESLLKNKLGQKANTETGVSVRRFKGFEVLFYEKESADDHGIWFAIRGKGGEAAHIRLLHARIEPEVLIGFNNTGNVCIWPAEEVMAYHLLERKESFRRKRICELGGGMTALAGLLLAVGVNAEEIHLTDGNIESANNIQDIIKRNEESFLTARVTSSQLVWGAISELNDSQKFDFVICADCLFFVEYQKDLVKTIWNILRDEGEAILFAPRRGKTMNSFLEMAKTSFIIEKFEKFDDFIWNKHESYLKNESMYDTDLHYPLLITMKKMKELASKS